MRRLDAEASDLGRVVAAREAAEELELVILPAGEGGAVVVAQLGSDEESATTLSRELEQLRGSRETNERS